MISIYAATYGLVAADDNETLGGLVETAVFSQWMHDPSWMSNLYYAKLAKNRGEVHIFKCIKIGPSGNKALVEIEILSIRKWQFQCKILDI